MHQLGYEKLYLITDHTTFYERYEWTFLTMVKEESGTTARLYQSDTIGLKRGMRFFQISCLFFFACSLHCFFRRK